MNINKLINELKKKIGLVGHLSTVISDTGIKDIIMMSLDEFNRYSSFPLYIPIRPYINSFLGCNVLPLYDSSYCNSKIEIPIGDEILEMCRLYGSEIKEARLVRDSATPFISPSVNMKQDMLAIQASHIKGINTQKPRLRYRAPNILLVENFSPNIMFYQAYIMVLRMTHPPTLSTISAGLQGWFVNLCQKNIEIVLYNNTLRFLNIDLGSVRVELNIENFQSAESEKKELLDQIKARASADDMVIYAN